MNEWKLSTFLGEFFSKKWIHICIILSMYNYKWFIILDLCDKSREQKVRSLNVPIKTT